LAYRTEWRQEAADELSTLFSKREQAALLRKIAQVVAGFPQSLLLKTVTPIRGADQYLSGNKVAIEIRVGSGNRAAVVVDNDAELATVYMVGKHDYAYTHYLSALDERLGR